MQIDQKGNHLRNLINEADNIAIIADPARSDSIASAAAFYQYLKANFSKSTDLIVFSGNSQMPAGEELKNLAPIKSNFSEQILKMTLDYNGTKMQTINHYPEGEGKMVFEMKPVNRDFNVAEKIKFEFVGSGYDLLITIGISALENLGENYTRNQAVFEKASIINIDNSSQNRQYGKLNIVEQEASSISAMLLNKFAAWDVKLTNEISEALLIGVRFPR